MEPVNHKCYDGPQEGLLISPNHHTGRRLPREHTAFNVLLLLTIAVGGLLLSVSRSAKAEQIAIYALVPGPPPQRPAVILSPQDGQHFNHNDISAVGTCQPSTLVKIFDDNVFVGAVICSASGQFSISLDLFPGQNQLRAETYNELNAPGPTRPAITVYYDLPGVAAGTSPLILTGDDLYKGYEVNQEISWTVSISGGQPPYALAIDWGDGQVEPLTQSQPGNITLHHTYKQAGPLDHNSYDVSIKAVDTANSRVQMQLVSIVSGRTTPIQPTGLTNSLDIVWPIWIIIMLLLIIFRLGEVIEKRILEKRQRQGLPI